MPDPGRNIRPFRAKPGKFRQKFGFFFKGVEHAIRRRGIVLGYIERDLD
jgi:hypothetical protein